MWWCLFWKHPPTFLKIKSTYFLEYVSRKSRAGKNIWFILVINRPSLSRFTYPGQVKIQTVREVNWGQYKNKLLIWLFSSEPNSWNMARYVKNRLKMKTEKTEKWWYFLKDDDHRWLFDNRNIGGNYWKTAETWHFVTQANFAHWLRS